MGSQLKTQPQALDMEGAVLGSMMLDHEAVLTVMEILRKEAFYSPKNQLVYQAIQELFNKNIPIDILTVSEKLKGQIDAHYITELTDRIGSTTNIEHHCRIVLQKYIQREVARVSLEMYNRAFNESEDPLELLAQTESQVFALINSLETRKVKHVSEVAVNSIKKRQAGERGVDIGLTKIKGGDLIILGGATSMGKTAKAINMMLEMARAGTPVLIFSLEMTEEQLYNRMEAIEAEVNSERISDGNMQHFEQERVSKAAAYIGELPIYLDDTPAINPTSVRAKAMKAKREYGIGAVFIDYLQMMSPNDKRIPREQQVTEISRSCKALAKEIDVPVIALAQLSRSVESRADKTPQLSDLRESGAIEQDADVVMFVYRPEYYKIQEFMYKGDTYTTDGLAVIYTAKNRNGGVGSMLEKYEKEYTKFKPYNQTPF